MENENTRGNLEIGGDTSVEIPEEETSEIEVVNELKRGKYSYVPIDELEWAYEKALHVYLSRVFPYQTKIVAIPDDRPRDKTWIKWCIEEILAMNNIVDGIPLKSYKENGISFTFSESLLSEGLLAMLPPPYIKVVGRK